jgi:hypothetical protein
MIKNKKEYDRKWRAAHPEYYIKYRAANPERTREAARKYRAAHPEKAREANRKYQAAHPEKIREIKRKYRAENLEKLRETSRKWYVANSEKAREKNRRWRAANPERIRATMKKWKAENPEKVSEQRKKWRAANPERVSEQNKKSLKTFREKNRDDPIYRMHQNMRSGMYSALKGRAKSASTMTIIGCTVEGLFEHLESCASWEPWMTRKKYGVGGWDVDHIIAIKKWEDDCPLQFVLCWDKSNLQPMEHIANIKKGSR